MRSDSELKGWEASVSLEDGTRLNEHVADVSTEDNTTICWLETPEDNDQHFSISLSKPRTAKRDRAYKACVTCDGRKLSSHDVLKGWSGTKMWDSMYVAEDGVLYSSKLKFGKLETTDEESRAITDEKVLKALGEIKIILKPGFFEERRVQASGRVEKAEKYGSKAPSGIVHEKSKKATNDMTIAAGTRTVVSLSSKPSRGMITQRMFIPSDGEPNHTFIFRYLSRAMLMARGIISGPKTLEIPAARPRSLKRQSSDSLLLAEPVMSGGDQNKEIEELEARLDFLRKSKKVKRESLASNAIASASTGPEAVRSNEIIDMTLSP